MNKLARLTGTAALALALAVGSNIAQAAPASAPHSALPGQMRSAAHGFTVSSAKSAQEATEPIGSRLDAGEVMGATEYLHSPSGQFALSADSYYGPDFGLVLDGPTSFPQIVSKTGVTTGDTDNVLAMQGDGNLVLYTNGKPTWWTGTAGNAGAYVTLQDDGNVVVYSSANKPLWASMTSAQTVDSFLEEDGGWGGELHSGWYVRSMDGRYRLVMQGDGNAVLYFGGRPLWSTGTFNNAGAYLTMQPDGNVVVYSAAGKPLWWSGTGRGLIADNRLVVQDDGNLVLYQFRASDNYEVARALWQSGTGARR